MTSPEPTSPNAMSVASATASTSTSDSGAPARIIELPASELDELISRVEQAKQAQLCLSADDCDLLLNAVLTLATMQERLSHNDLTIAKLKKLLGIVRSSEKTKDLFPDAGNGKTADDQPRGSGTAHGTASHGADDKNENNKNNKNNENNENNENGKKDKRDSRDTRSGDKGRTKPGRKPHKPEPATVHKHGFEALNPGDPCPACPSGRLYRYEPATLLRIVGNKPLSRERHLSDQLRCGTCGQIYTAPLPAHVKADGHPGQRYGYTARTYMAIFRFFAGLPFHRQETIHNLMGGHVAASTVLWSKRQGVVNTISPSLLPEPDRHLSAHPALPSNTA